MPNTMSNLKKRLMHCIRDSISFILYLLMAWKKRKGVVTLVYHSVDKIDPSRDPYRLSITPEKFEEHLKIISKHKDDIKITFDDGYGDNFKYAFPLLRKYGCTATIFLITDYVDGKIGSQEFCGEDLGLSALTWEEIKAMDNSGIAFGSHSKTHPKLSMLPRDAIRAELLGSKERIESMVDHKIDSLAYPFGSRGSFNKAVAEVAAESGYRYAYTNIMGALWSGSGNNFELRRIRIYSEDGPLKLKMKLKGAYDWVDAFLKDSPLGT
jgi:peptidoglycan/xylan/chitin deacetylase (PgdA/CDA1 family)